MSKFLIALDQSTQTTGYAIFKDQQLLTVGHINPAGKDYIERIASLRQWLEKILDTLETDVEVAIEDIQLQQYEPNGGKKVSKDFGVITYKKLAHVQGALLSLCAARKIKYTIVSPSSWRKTCGIAGVHRDEKKRNAQIFIQKQFNLQPTEDEADAACIGYHMLQAPSNDGFDWS